MIEPFPDDRLQSTVLHEQGLDFRLFANLSQRRIIFGGKEGRKNRKFWPQIQTGFSGDGTVHESDLRAFYEHFVGVSSDEIDKVTANGYAQMTANGDYKLCR